VVRAALTVLALALLSFALYLMVGSGIRHEIVQHSELARFRIALANGTAPIGPLKNDGKHLIALGTPVAYLTIPTIDVHEVVDEGTTGDVLARGPGHLRSSVLPGQSGVSVVFGRSSAYGGPFRDLGHLRKGDVIKAVTGIGQSTYKVVDVRKAGDKVPPLPNNGSRLVLTTSRGGSYMPSGLLYVDADLASPPQASSPQGVTTSQLLPAERANAIDTGSVWEAVLWLQALLIVAVLAVWSWSRWGRYRTVITFVPVVLLFDILLSDQLVRLMPNLL
jgi:LPXTG-site transpeptidase (sortase) family protein